MPGPACQGCPCQLALPWSPAAPACWLAAVLRVWLHRLNEQSMRGPGLLL